MLQEKEVVQDNFDNVNFIPDEKENVVSTEQENNENFDDVFFVPDEKQPNLLQADLKQVSDSPNSTGVFGLITDAITAKVKQDMEIKIREGAMIESAVGGAVSSLAEPANIAGATLQVVGDLTDSNGVSELGQEMSNTVQSFNEMLGKDWLIKDESIDPKIKHISRILGAGGGQVLQMQGIAKSIGGAFTYALYTVPDASDVYLGYRKEGYGKTEAGTAGLATGAGFYAIDRFFDGAKLMNGMKNTSLGLLDVLLEPTAEMSQEAYKNMIFKIGPEKTRDLMSGVVEAGIGGLAGGMVGSASVSINGVEYNPNTNYETARQEALDAGATEEDVNNLMAEMYTNIDSNPEKVSKYLTDLANKNAEQITSMIREMPKSVAYQSVTDFYKTVDEFITENEGTPEAERAKQTKAELDNVYKDTYSALENLMPKQEADANARLVQGHALFASQEFGVSPKEYMDTMFAKVEQGGEDFLGEAQYQMGGEKAKTAALDKLEKAKRLGNEKANPEDIRKKTGWFKGKDGKWRFEISDKDARFKSDELLRFKKYTDEKGNKVYETTLGALIEHEKIFEAYPELKDIDVIITEEEQTGDYVKGGEIIDGKIKLYSDALYDRTQGMKTLMHEIQHLIQGIEGFARGGSPSDYTNALLKLQGEIDSYKKQLINEALLKKFGKKFDGFGASWIYGDAFLNKPLGDWFYKKEGLSRSEVISELNKQKEEIVGKYERFAKETKDNFKYKTSTQYYKSIYGEVEARNTTERMNLDDSQRLEKSVESTQDIPTEDAIVIFDDGTTMSYEPQRFYQDETNPRGAYYRGIIHLFQNADPSTFVHESMHFYKEELMKIKDKSAKAKSILETLESFASNEFAKNYMVLAKGGRFYVADKNGRTVYDKQGRLFETGNEAREYAKDELISKGFEQYVREGESPSKFLTRAFHSFMNWLKHIYKSAKDLGVELNDSVRQAYGDLLGGQDLDYWMGQPEEAIISEVQSVEQDRKKYLDDVINQAVKEKGTKVSEGRGRGFRDIWTRSMIPLSTRAKRVSPLLQTRLRRFEFSLANNLNKKYDLSRPFLDIWKNMSEEDAIAFDLALKNDYVEKQLEIVEKYNAAEQWAKIKGVLADIYTDAIGVGLELGYREDYFPRKVKDVDGFLSYMRGLEDWTRYQEALREADPENVFTPEEQADFINKYMRGFVRVDLMPVKYGSEKQRKVSVVNNEINRFYAPSIDSYVSYIEGMNARIESAKFLGKDAENYDESIGGYLTYLQEQNLIKPNQIDEVRDILRARFGHRGVSNRFLGTARDLSYIYTMGGINSAITQIEDLSVSMYKAGVWNTLTTMFSGKEITRKDIGVENISQEFVSQKKTSKWLNGLFKATGLDAIDGFGKETLINSIIKKYKQIYEKNPQTLRDYLEPIMEDQTSSVINDILNDNKSDNLMYLVFSELSDVQPVSLSELPEFYNTAGNLRVLYMLKSFMVKRIDTFRNECFDKLKSKDTSVRIEGLQNLFRLSVLMIICGATKDWIIDLLYGRKTDMSETLVNNVLGMFGISKFHLYKAREQGFSGVLKEFVVPPLFSFWDDIIGDVFDVKEGKRKLKDLEVLKGIPLFGRFYYWWIGRGAEKQKKKRGKSRRR